MRLLRRVWLGLLVAATAAAASGCGATDPGAVATPGAAATPAAAATATATHAVAAARSHVRVLALDTFARRARAICARLDPGMVVGTHVVAGESPASRSAKFDRWAALVVPRARRELRELRALGVPHGHAAEYRRMLAALRELTADVNRFGMALHNRDADGAVLQLREIGRLGRDATRVAARLGLQSCVA